MKYIEKVEGENTAIEESSSDQMHDVKIPKPGDKDFVGPIKK